MKSVVWLQLHSDQISLQETWEYKKRRSMISASVFLCLKTEGNKFSGFAEGSIKIPFKGKYGFEAFGDLLPGRSPVEFTSLSVRPSLENSRTQKWEIRDGALCYEDSASAESSRHEIKDLSFGRVLSPLAVIPSLTHSWVGADVEYRGILVAGRKPTALRILAQNPNAKSISSIQIQVINFSNLSSRFEEKDWSELPWQKAFVLSGQYDESRKELTSVSASAPIVGQISLDLHRHETIRS